VTDWGLTRSDITYDVVHVWEGKFFRIDDYLDRFMVSIEKLRLDIPQSRDEIKRILHQMVSASGLQSAYVSMVASRGTPSIPGTRDCLRVVRRVLVQILLIQRLRIIIGVI